MRLQLNQIVRAAQAGVYANDIQYDEEGYVNLYYLSSDGGNLTPMNIQRPMFSHSKIQRKKRMCYPVMYFHSNPFKTDRKVKPWTDILLPDEGYVYYNGDNQTPGSMPKGKPNSGNQRMEELWKLYFSKKLEDRKVACPILIFEQTNDVKGKKKGYRKFRGYGIVTKIEVRQEFAPKTDSVFSNYLFEISLLKIPPEGLDWQWINDRRDEMLSLEDSNRNAPKAWKDWVKNGNSAIERNRQKILHYEIADEKEQREELSNLHKQILDKVVEWYPESKDKGKFEALASLIASEYFGNMHYERGWVTKQSGDMGVDFVGGLKITNEHAPNPPGTVLGNTQLIVIGQAKCRTKYYTHKGEDAKDIARVASRLQRGYVGIYVTTGVYKKSTQKEVSIDKYPIILINGRQMADLLHLYSTRTGKDIKTILIESDEWMEKNNHNWLPQTYNQRFSGEDISPIEDE